MACIDGWPYFWDTRLSDERQRQILDWVKSLPPEQKKMLDDVVQDEREDEQWHADAGEGV